MSHICFYKVYCNCNFRSPVRFFVLLDDQPLCLICNCQSICITLQPALFYFLDISLTVSFISLFFNIYSMYLCVFHLEQPLFYCDKHLSSVKWTILRQIIQTRKKSNFITYYVAVFSLKLLKWKWITPKLLFTINFYGKN